MIDPTDYLNLPPALRGQLYESLSPREQALLDRSIAEHAHTTTNAPDPLAHLTAVEWHREVWDRKYFSSGYAPFHLHFWDWVDGIKPDIAPRPYYAMWGRGLAKSTNAEAATVVLAARQLRSYWLYVCDTQSQADDHVGTIAAMLEAPGIARHYPNLSEPKVGKHGNQKGWRRSRVWTAAGFVVDAFGLDSAVRGAKLEEQRPDGAVFDDIDDRGDTPETVKRKEGTIANAILPALTSEAAIVVAQNYTHSGAIGARLEDGRADFMRNRILAGPVPAVEGMVAKPNPDYDEEDERSPTHRITEGVSSWPEGLPLDEAEMRITRYGLHAFETESNNKRGDVKGALWTSELIDRHRVNVAPQLDRIAVGIDPNKTGRADDAGIVVAGMAWVDNVRHGFVLEDLTETSVPEVWRDKAADAYLRWKASSFVVERTGLGDHAKLTVKGAPALRDVSVPVDEVEARISKMERARPVVQLYRDGRVHHVGTHHVVEEQQTTWVPKRSSISPGGVDALVHVLTKLLLDPLPSAGWNSSSEWANDGGRDWSVRPT